MPLLPPRLRIDFVPVLAGLSCTAVVCCGAFIGSGLLSEDRDPQPRAQAGAPIVLPDLRVPIVLRSDAQAPSGASALGAAASSSGDAVPASRAVGDPGGRDAPSPGDARRRLARDRAPVEDADARLPDRPAAPADVGADAPTEAAPPSSLPVEAPAAAGPGPTAVTARRLTLRATDVAVEPKDDEARRVTVSYDVQETGGDGTARAVADRVAVNVTVPAEQTDAHALRVVAQVVEVDGEAPALKLSVGLDPSPAAGEDEDDDVDAPTVTDGAAATDTTSNVVEILAPLGGERDDDEGEGEAPAPAPAESPAAPTELSAPVTPAAAPTTQTVDVPVAGAGPTQTTPATVAVAVEVTPTAAPTSAAAPADPADDDD